MTDKQLALLLRQIAGRIRSLAAEIEPLIESGEMHSEDVIKFGSSGDGPAFRRVATDRFAAVQRVLDLAGDIEDEAELLNLNPQPAAE